MTVFEHLTTLASFMLALGIATFLQFIANLLKHRGRIVWSGPLVLYAIAVFLSQVTYWLSAFGFRSAPHSSLVSIGFNVIYPMLLYVQAELVSAQPASGSVIDLADYEQRHRRLYLGVLAGGFLVVAAYLFWLGRLNPTLSIGRTEGSLALQCVACIVAWLWSRRTVQWLAASVVCLMNVAGFLQSAQSLIVVD